MKLRIREEFQMLEHYCNRDILQRELNDMHTLSLLLVAYCLSLSVSFSSHLETHLRCMYTAIWTNSTVHIKNNNCKTIEIPDNDSLTPCDRHIVLRFCSVWGEICSHFGSSGLSIIRPVITTWQPLSRGRAWWSTQWKYKNNICRVNIQIKMKPSRDSRRLFSYLRHFRIWTN